MGSLTKADMAERLSSEHNLSNFDLRDKRSRPGRNPKTGEEVAISARRVVTFRPGQKLKDRVESVD